MLQQDHAQSAPPAATTPALLYAAIIYWSTLLGATITLAGTALAFIGGHNLADPGRMMANMLQGLPVNELWQTAGGSPGTHWFLADLAKGDALTMAGIALGALGLVPASLAAAWLMWRNGERIMALLGALGAALTLAAFLGWIA